MKKIIASLMCLIAISATAIAEDYSAPLSVETKDGSVHEFLVELAVTPAERQKGMMHRTSLGPDQGMLFLFREPERLGFWMRNTLIPLDIIFVRENGKIANIIENAEPGTDTARMSKGRAVAVLELAGGRARELGIRSGDRVQHPLIGALPRLTF